MWYPVVSLTASNGRVPWWLVEYGRDIEHTTGLEMQNQSWVELREMPLGE